MRRLFLESGHTEATRGKRQRKKRNGSIQPHHRRVPSKRLSAYQEVTSDTHFAAAAAASRDTDGKQDSLCCHNRELAGASTPGVRTPGGRGKGPLQSISGSPLDGRGVGEHRRVQTKTSRPDAPGNLIRQTESAALIGCRTVCFVFSASFVVRSFTLFFQAELQ